MSVWYLTPTWFSGYDAILQLVFGLITLILALFAIRIFKVTSERTTKLFGSGFLLISIAYFVQSALNFFALHELAEPIQPLIKLNQAITIGFVAAYFHLLLMICGLIVLLYMSFSIKEKKVLAALLLIGVLPMLFDTDIVYTYQIISTISLIFIASYFVKNYLKKKHALRFFTAAGFAILLLSSIIFFFAVQDKLFYVAGNALEFLAYLLLLINFYLVLKK